MRMMSVKSINFEYLSVCLFEIQLEMLDYILWPMPLIEEKGIWTEVIILCGKLVVSR